MNTHRMKHIDIEQSWWVAEQGARGLWGEASSGLPSASTERERGQKKWVRFFASYKEPCKEPKREQIRPYIELLNCIVGARSRGARKEALASGSVNCKPTAACALSFRFLLSAVFVSSSSRVLTRRYGRLLSLVAYVVTPPSLPTLPLSPSPLADAPCFFFLSRLVQYPADLGIAKRLALVEI